MSKPAAIPAEVSTLPRRRQRDHHAGGVTAGIDLALGLVERRHDDPAADRIAGQIEYQRPAQTAATRMLE